MDDAERWSRSWFIYLRSWHTFVKRTLSSTTLIYFHLGMSQCEFSSSQENKNEDIRETAGKLMLLQHKYYCGIDSCNCRQDGHHLDIELVNVPADHRNSSQQTFEPDNYGPLGFSDTPCLPRSPCQDRGFRRHPGVSLLSQPSRFKLQSVICSRQSFCSSKAPAPQIT